MIRLLEGIVADESPKGLVVSVGGIGYFVHTTSKIHPQAGGPIRLFTYLAVRETALDLYGFRTQGELDFFELLLTIPKIGPKSALQILDQADVSLLVESINLGDAAHLSKLSGIGKKTAEKIVLDLRDKIEPFTLATTADTSSANEVYTDAFDTLITLGYNPTAVRQVLDTFSFINAEVTTSQIVKVALQKLI